MLHHAVLGGDLCCVQHVVNHAPLGQLMRAKTTAGFTPLHCAGQSSDAAMAPIASALLRGGAAWEDTDVEGRTPLHVAAMSYNLPVSCFGTGVMTAPSGVAQGRWRVSLVARQ